MIVTNSEFEKQFKLEFPEIYNIVIKDFSKYMEIYRYPFIIYVVENAFNLLSEDNFRGFNNDEYAAIDPEESNVYVLDFFKENRDKLEFWLL